MPTLQEIQAEEEQKRLAKATTQAPTSPTLPTQAIPMPSSTPSTTPTMGIVPKAPVATPETPVTPTEKPLSTFNQNTAGQDVQFRQTYRQSMEVPKTEAPVTTTTTPTSPTGLSGAELQAYNQLSPIEQETYKKLATQGVKAQTDYLTKAKANIEFNQSQQDTKMKMQSNENAIYEIQSQENLAQAKKSLDNLKQNIGFIGMWGQPWKSMAKMDAISNQVATAEKTYNNILEVDRLMKENRALWQEANVEIFSRQMKLLQDDLVSKVNKSIQWALNQFNSAELEGKLDTIPEVEAFQQQLYAQLDWDFSSIMDTNIEARKFLIERYDKLAESQKEQMANAEKAKVEREKNKNTLNKDMSNALGYFVNNNGEPLVDQTTGQRIVVPPETTTNYDASTGQMILMTKNRDGSIWIQIKQVGNEKPTEWKESTQQPWMAFDPSTGTYKNATAGGMLNVPRTGNNVWQDTNNPWNIMGDTQWQRDIATRLGAIGFYQSPNGRTYAVFPDMQTGVQASMSDLQTKLNGGSSWATPDTTLAKFASGWVSWPNAPLNQNAVNNYVKFTGASANTPIKDIPLETLAKAIFANEWVDISKSANLSGVTGTQWATQDTVWWYSQDDYINRITAMLPAGMKDNKSEMDRVTKMTKSYMAQWMTPQEAVLKFSGYEIQDKDLTDIGMAYVDIGDNLLTLKPKNYEATVSKYMNKWDFDWLNTYINGLADDKVKDRYGADSVLSTTYKVGNDRTDTLVSLINANKDKIGAFDWNVNDFLNKFKSDPQYQKLKTILTMSQADTRKYFAGSAVTATEMDALKDFIGGKTTMTPENLVTILETIKEDRNNTFETQRRGLMPPKTQAVQAKKKLGWLLLTDIISKLK